VQQLRDVHCMVGLYSVLCCRYKQKLNAWNRKTEAERQQDRAFAMQSAHAAHASGTQLTSSSVVVCCTSLLTSPSASYFVSNKKNTKHGFGESFGTRSDQNCVSKYGCASLDGYADMVLVEKASPPQ
jgi:hypothetical protein